MPPTRLHAPVDAVPRSAVRTREPLVDAATLAVELGVSRDFVYEHAVELGALKLGSGPKARLRFDPVAARAALAGNGCYGSKPSQVQAVNAGGRSEVVPAPRSGKRRVRSPQPGSILPVRPRPRRRKAAGS
jgi:hypothetical protein